jgi:hypothetical protein
MRVLLGLEVVTAFPVLDDVLQVVQQGSVGRFESGLDLVAGDDATDALGRTCPREVRSARVY